MDPSDVVGRQTLAFRDIMVVPDPPHPPQFVGEVLGNGRLPNALTKIIASRFRMVHEDGVALSTENRAVRGLHSFLANLASGVDLVPGLERL